MHTYTMNIFTYVLYVSTGKCINLYFQMIICMWKYISICLYGIQSINENLYKYGSKNAAPTDVCICVCKIVELSM